MSKNNPKEDFLKVREIINETLIRDVFLFVILYLFILAQSWSNIFLLLFPIITFGFSLFFRTITTNKFRMFLNLDKKQIKYNPIGLEKKHANRLKFTALVQLILLFWIGAESLYHPQLIETHDLFFNFLFPLSFMFGFYWIFTDIWKNSKISIGLEDNNSEKVISFLHIRFLKLISLANLSCFILLNLLNLSFTLLIDNNILSGLSYFLPGTGIENSLPLEISIIYFFIIWISPILACFLLLLIYKHVNNINKTDFLNYLRELPENSRKKLIQNFKALNKRFSRDLNNE